MTVEPKPHEMRKLVTQIFKELGAAIPLLSDLEETVLNHEGKYTIRSYRVTGYMAMWLVEVGIIQFYDAAGNMLATVNLFTESKSLKIAA